jgi:haloalkane dehalogenase
MTPLPTQKENHHMTTESANIVATPTRNRVGVAASFVAPPRPSWLDEKLFPFTSHYVNIDGNLVHHVDEGDGPTLLFMHSNFVWSFTYRHVIKGLRDRFRCVALDFPGFGLSTAAPGFSHTIMSNSVLVEKFMQALNLTGVTLVGHDSGGLIGMGVISRRPDWFRAVVMMDTISAPLKELPLVNVMLRIISAPFPGGIINDQLNLIVPSVDKEGMKRRKLLKGERAAFAGPFPTPESRRITRTLFASIVDNPDYVTELLQKVKQLNIPALLMPSEKSGAVELLLPGLEATFPNHRTVILEGAGHFSAEDSPDEVVTAIRGWWESDIEKKEGRLT